MNAIAHLVLFAAIICAVSGVGQVEIACWILPLLLRPQQRKIVTTVMEFIYTRK